MVIHGQDPIADAKLSFCWHEREDALDVHLIVLKRNGEPEPAFVCFLEGHMRHMLHQKGSAPRGLRSPDLQINSLTPWAGLGYQSSQT